MASSNSPLAAFTRWPAQALPRTFWRGRPWLQALLGLGLALFAAWIRLRHLGYTEIFHDQARTLNIALQWLHGGPFPLTADFSSLGVYNPPLVEYLYALALFAKEDILYLVPVPPVLMALFAERIANWLRAWAAGQARWARESLALAPFLPLALVAFQQARLDVLGQDLLADGASGHQRIVDTRRAIEAARGLLAERPGCQLVVFAETPIWESSRFGLMREFVGADRTRFADPSARLYPTTCAVYFDVTEDRKIARWLGRVAHSLPDRTIHTPEETWNFYDLPAPRRDAAVERLTADVPVGTWANGLRLWFLEVRGSAPAGADGLSLVYTWEVTEALPAELKRHAEALRFGNYLLSAENALVSQMDGVGLDSREWRPGDVFQTFWQLPIPPDLSPGRYTLATAVYSLPDVLRVPLADGSGDLLVLDRLDWTNE